MIEEIESAKAVVSKAYLITDYLPEVQEQWLVEVGKSLEGLEQIEDGIIIFQAEVLYNVWSIWDAKNNDEGRTLSLEAKAPWKYDFYKWAKSYTKRRAGREPANITIDNKITTFRDWKAQEVIEAPETVYIPKRNEYGQLENPDLTKQDAWEAVKFDFKDCDYGKLLVCRATAKKGEMSPEAWSTLRDPHSTVQDLQNAMAGDRTRNRHKDEDFYIDIQDGIIYGCQNGHRTAVMQTLFENEADDLFKKTYCHILRAAGLPVPVEFQV